MDDPLTLLMNFIGPIVLGGALFIAGYYGVEMTQRSWQVRHRRGHA